MKIQKKKLLDMIRCSNLKNIEEISHLYSEYYPQLENLLYFLPNKTVIEVNSEDFKNFKDKDVFYRFIDINTNNPQKVKEELEKLLNTLKMWIFNTPSIFEIITVQQKKDRRLKIFLVIAVLSITITFVLCLLDIFEIIGWGDKLSISLDGIGLITSLLFFIYERISDSKKEKFIKNITSDGGKTDPKPIPTVIKISPVNPINSPTVSDSTNVIVNYYH